MCQPVERIQTELGEGGTFGCVDVFFVAPCRIHAVNAGDGILTGRRERCVICEDRILFRKYIVIEPAVLDRKTARQLMTSDKPCEVIFQIRLRFDRTIAVIRFASRSAFLPYVCVPVVADIRKYAFSDDIRGG